MKKRICLFMFFLVFVFQVTSVFSKDQKKIHIEIVQEKIFHKYHELGAWMGYIPNDDFYLSYPIALNYVFHFNDLLSWEVLRLEMLVNQDKDMKDNLKNNFRLAPKEIACPKYMIHSSFQFKPLYGKSSFFNKRVINHETYFLVGGGLIGYDKEYSYGNDSSETALSLSIGIGMRYFINKNFCFNIEIRDNLHFMDQQTENRMYLGIGLGFRFNLSPREREEDIKLNGFKNYLREAEQDE